MKKKKDIRIINGPNLNLLGGREPETYGSTSFEIYFEKLKESFPEAALACFQSNHEGKLLDELHRIGFSADGIILNAGAYTHTSVALHDAVKAITTPVLEVHISNLYAREAFRHKSFLSSVCLGSVIGLGLEGYRLGVHYFLERD